MAEQWEYVVSPKIWDTDEDLTDMINMLHTNLGYEFIGAVELQGWEHHVWRKPKAPPRAQASEGWGRVLGQLASASGKELDDRARRFLASLAGVEEPAGKAAKRKSTKGKKAKKKKKRK